MNQDLEEFPSYSDDSMDLSGQNQYIFKYQSDEEDDGVSDDGIPYDDIYVDGYDYRFVERINEIQILDDADYMQWLNIQTPPIIPSKTNPTQDLIAIIIGIFMAKGETLDVGLTADEFDIQLKECTGFRSNTNTQCISMLDLLSYINPTEEEYQKCTKDKANILLNEIFKPYVTYSPADSRFKLKLPNFLKDLYDSVKASGTIGHRRRDKAEKVKNDKMVDPVNRQKYMITNNMLVEMIAEISSQTCEYEATWQRIQNLFREMMNKEENHKFFQKYNTLLDLKRLKETNGCELNTNACRELLGRGTPSKAISHPIYQKITLRNDPKKGLCLRLDGENMSIKSFTYGKEDFIEIQREIDIANNIKQERFKEHKIADAKSKKEQQRIREEAECQERKKHFIPINIQDENVFIPNVNNQRQQSDFNHSIEKRSETQKRMSNNSVRNVINSRENSYMYKQLEYFEQTDEIHMHRERTENIFGQVNVNDDAMSSASEEAIDHGPNFTDEEDTYQKPEKKGKKERNTQLTEVDGYIKVSRNSEISNASHQQQRSPRYPASIRQSASSCDVFSQHSVNTQPTHKQSTCQVNMSHSVIRANNQRFFPTSNTSVDNLLKPFKPLGDRVLVERVITEPTIRGGIRMPEKAQMLEAIVINAGPGARNERGDVVPLSVRPGDRVLLPEYGGTKVIVEEKEYTIFREQDLLGVFQ